MSNKHRLSWIPNVNEWYHCKLVEDRYRIIHMSSGLYWVVSWNTAYNVCAGSLNDCRKFVHGSCMNHEEYCRRYI